MPASAIVSASNWLDTDATYLIAEFSAPGDSYGYSSPLCQVDQVVYQAGPDPSYAVVRIPLAAFEETAPAVACVKSGPMGGIRVGSRCTIKASNGYTVLQGTVVTPAHNLGNDQATITVMDDRFLLEGCQFVGSFWATATGIAYRQGVNPIVNPNGVPNAIWRNGYPVFCEPNFGLNNDQAPARFSVASTLYSGHWNNAMLWKYTHYAFNSGAALARAAWPKYKAAPSTLVWPSTVDAIFTGTQRRKAKSRPLAPNNANNLLYELAQEEGNYLPYVKNNQLLLLDMDASTEGNSVVRPAAGDEAATAFNVAQVIEDGHLQEDGRNLYTTAWTSGLLTLIETRISYIPGGSHGLIAAWSDADYATFKATWIKTMVDTSGNIGLAMIYASKAAPKVFAAYRLDPTYNFQAGTSESGKPRAAVGRPILDSLLTRLREDGNGVTAGNSLRREIEWENRQSGNWYPSEAVATGMMIDADGTIWLPGWRAGSLTYEIDDYGSYPDYSSASISPRAIRATVAIPCDHAVNAYATAGNDHDRIQPGFSRLYHASSDLYGKEIRVGSYPQPESTGGTSKTSILRDDSIETLEHAKRRIQAYGKLMRGGQLVFPHLLFAWNVGQKVSTLKTGNSVYPIYSPVRRILFDPRRQKTILAFDDQPFLMPDYPPEPDKAAAQREASYDATKGPDPRDKPAPAPEVPYEDTPAMDYNPQYGGKPQETQYGPGNYSPTNTPKKKEAYDPNAAPDQPGNASSAAPAGSVAEQKAMNNGEGKFMDEEDRAQTGKGAAKEAETVKTATEGNSVLNNLVAEKTARDQAAAATEATPAKKSSGQGDEMLKAAFGI